MQMAIRSRGESPVWRLSSHARRPRVPDSDRVFSACGRRVQDFILQVLHCPKARMALMHASQGLIVARRLFPQAEVAGYAVQLDIILAGLEHRARRSGYSPR